MQTTIDNKRYLVVGVNGTIGSALFARLLADNKNVFATTQRSEHVSNNIFFLNILDEEAKWHLPEEKYDVVYLCAGICKMHLCDENPEATRKVNVHGMARLAKYFSVKGAFIIYLSTNQVFSGTSPFVAEDSDYQPLNEYGRQKSIAEKMIMSACPNAAVVRLTKVIEPNMSLLASWIDRLHQEQPVEAFKDMMLAPVALNHVIDVLVTLGDCPKRGYYHVSGIKDISYYDAALYIAKALGCDESLVHAVSALDKGLKKTYIPQFTTLLCSSTIAHCSVVPQKFEDVMSESFNFKKS